MRTLLQRGEVACGALVKMFPLTAFALSHHFRVLQECGLMEVRKEGVYHFFRVNVQLLERIAPGLAAVHGHRRG